jgi:hypothetical protein
MRFELRTTHPHRLTRLEDWIPRECKDFEPPSSGADRMVFLGCAVLLMVLVVIA